MSDNEKVVGRPIGNLLYTVESEESKEKTKAELKAGDPSPERALGILEEKNDKKVN